LRLVAFTRNSIYGCVSFSAQTKCDRYGVTTDQFSREIKWELACSKPVFPNNVMVKNCHNICQGESLNSSQSEETVCWKWNMF